MTITSPDQSGVTPDAEQPMSVIEALEFARDYERMAGFLTAHPDLAATARHDRSHRFLLPVQSHKDPLQQIASAARTAREAGAEVVEYVTKDYGGIQIRFGHVALQVYASADRMVREVVVGHVPDVRRSLVIDLDGNPRKVAEQAEAVA